MQDSEYEEFVNRSEEAVVMAIFDKLGVCAPCLQTFTVDDSDRSWAYQ